MKPNKILHVISDTNFGGAGRLLLIFLAHVNRDEFDISVVLPENSLMKAEIEKLGIRTIEAAGIADKSFSFKGVKNLRRIFKEEMPQIIHTHAVLSGRIAAKTSKPKLKVVHTRHSVHTNQDLLDEPAYKKKFPYKNIVGAFNNYLSDTIIATSPVAKHSMIETGANQKKTIVVYNGIDGLEAADDEKKAALRHKYGLKGHEFVCSILGRIEKVKGHKHVLKAAEMVQREDKSIKFLIVGTGSDEEEIKKQAVELNLENCIFTGFVEDVSEVLNITDLQINASITETTNLALLEGLSLYVPAIASDRSGSGNPFVINDGVNGLLFEEGDYAALAKGILSVKENPEMYSRLREKAREIFLERFDSKVMTAKVEKIYRDLLEKEAEVVD